MTMMVITSDLILVLMMAMGYGEFDKELDDAVSQIIENKEDEENE